MKARSEALITFKSRCPADTLSLAGFLAGLLKGGEVLSLKGMIGAGKTFFVKGLAGALGSKTSPVSASFNLMRTYKGGKREGLVPRFGPGMNRKSVGLKLYHFDLFRVLPEEMNNIGLEDYLGAEDGVTAIEWASPAGYLYGRGDFLELDFELTGGDTRSIGARASGASAVKILEGLKKKWPKK
jgi:tRNA threonylcarbamoyladenosine biosynthesis protein TsaE